MGGESFDYPTMARALIVGDKDTVARKTREGLDLSLDPKTLIFKGLIPGMDVVGEKFRRNEYYVPQVLLSARAMYAGLDLLKPLITASAKGDDYYGVVVIGPAQGDLHDIGKNLVAMMLEGAGFKVVNLGRDVAPEAFVRAVEEHNANIVGISALMTTTMPAMKRTIDALVRAGLRERVKVMVGGAPVSQAFADEIGADGYARDSTLAVVRAKTLVGVEARGASPCRRAAGAGGRAAGHVHRGFDRPHEPTASGLRARRRGDRRGVRRDVPRAGGGACRGRGGPLRGRDHDVPAGGDRGGARVQAGREPSRDGDDVLPVRGDARPRPHDVGREPGRGRHEPPRRGRRRRRDELRARTGPGDRHYP